MGKLPFLALVWGISLAILLGDGLLTHTTGLSIKPSIVLYCITSFLFFYVLACKTEVLSPGIEVKIQWLSNQSFLVYLVHPLAIALLSPVYGLLGIDFLLSRSINIPIQFLLVTGCSVLFAYIMGFTPLAVPLGGGRNPAGRAKPDTALKA